MAIYPPRRHQRGKTCVQQLPIPAPGQMRSAATAASTTAQKAVADTAKNASAAEQMSQCAAMRTECIS